ncbi:hypothetical protein, partial [Acinetobacter baumannii]|uniref:hypothetical protein n=1 Tax=Acinetobacter baumannii TaxID=470 RepID=UPI001C07BA08
DRQLRSNVGKSQEIGSTESTISREVCLSDGTIAPELRFTPASVDSNASPLEQTPAATSRQSTIPKNLLRVKKDFVRDICSLDETFVEEKMTETKDYSIANAMAL